ncbi:MAG: HAMP domain-containing histidine kinase, partial [Clostridia bacterium]|nr:HAMP domain-containing histidine kinase [Clostridia bacterium]
AASDVYKRQNEVLEKSVEKVNGLAVTDNIRICLSQSEDCRILMDRDKLVQALINILGNCIRYARSEITVASIHKGQFVEIRINDDGEGFAKEDMENIFKRFYKGKKGSTGLGLAITKAIIEKHRGTISASNGSNGGAEFKILLPK